MALLGMVGARMLGLAFVFMCVFVVEQLIPAERGGDIRGALLNCAAGLFFIFTEAVSSLIVASIFGRYSWSGLTSFLAVSDGGSVARATRLAFLWLGFRDFFYYWFHRLQHASRWLWAEHELHHSDEHLNVTTSVRHHWLEMPLEMFFVAGPFIYLFRPPLITVPVVSVLLGMVGVLIHANVRLGFGRLGWLIASPQNHRVHHSRLAEHADKNFAQFLPLWDVLFGTYYAPRPGEFPPTGSMSGERVETLGKSLTLPFLTWRKMLKDRD